MHWEERPECRIVTSYSFIARLESPAVHNKFPKLVLRLRIGKKEAFNDASLRVCYFFSLIHKNDENIMQPATASEDDQRSPMKYWPRFAPSPLIDAFFYHRLRSWLILRQLNAVARWLMIQHCAPIDDEINFITQKYSMSKVASSQLMVKFLPSPKKNERQKKHQHRSML